MANRLDSTSLFLAQVNQHAEVLGGLLTGVTQGEIDRDLIERCIVGTNMLAKSASLMELGDWQTSLDAYQSLLKVYRDKRLPWDERIAQITSEIIEKEDLLVANAATGGPSRLGAAVTAEELQAVSRELSELLDYTAQAPVGRDVGTPVPAPSTEGCGPNPTGRGSVDSDDDAASEHPASHDSRGGSRLLDASVAELRRNVDEVFKAWESLDGAVGDRPSVELDDLRTGLLTVGFLACAMERIVSDRDQGLGAPIIRTLASLRAAVQDDARLTVVGNDRQVDIAFSGEDRPIDARLLQPIHRVLRHLAGDILLRCSERHLRIEVGVEEKDGAFLWTLRDNGENFVADSHLDRDEYLAFYPGLRDTRKILGDLNSLLWVEPNGSVGARFAFSTPVSLQDSCFMVWGSGKDAVAVLSQQLAGVYPTGDVELTSDSRGERVAADGRQVRLLQLGQLCSEGPSDGDRIAVIGSVEKRVAFYVQGEGRLENGTWQKDGKTTRRGKENDAVYIGDERIPFVEANGLLQKYMAIVDAVSEENVSGGVDVEVSDPSHAQAKKEKDAKTPPERSSRKGGVDVLVVEQSGSLRSALDSILSKKGFVTKVTDGLETALAFLDKGRVSVIISDFRVPSMAAKVVADRLRREGRGIPVLVTTSHHGENADVLVNRLGVAGYISKPLNPDEVVSRVTQFADRPVGEPSRSP